MKARLNLYDKVIEYLVVAPAILRKILLVKSSNVVPKNTLNHLRNSKARYSRAVVKIDDFVGLLREITQNDEKCRNIL